MTHVDHTKWTFPFSKRDFWQVFLSLAIGIGLGMQFMSFMVPDANHWISLYHEQNRLNQQAQQRMNLPVK